MEQYPTFQARATQLLRKLKWHTRLADRRSNDNLSLPSNNPSSLPPSPSPDILRKPPMSSPLAAYDPSIPTDTDDSSSSNSPTRQSRRYSAWDAPTLSSVTPVYPAHGPPSLFLPDISPPQGTVVAPAYDGANVLPPAPSTERLAPPINDPSSTLSDSLVSQDVSTVPDQSLPMERSQTPRPAEGLLPSNEPVTNIAMIDQHRPSPSPTPPPISSSTIQERRTPGTQLTSPLPSPFRVATDRGLRLSPSIIARPMQILRLPVLPVPTPQETPVSPTVRLRHVPSLSVHGRPIVAPEPDSPAGDEDEDDDGDDDNDGDRDEPLRNQNLDHQSDEDSDREEMRTPRTGYSQHHSPLPPVTPSVAGPSSIMPDDILSDKSISMASNQQASAPKSLSPRTSFVESIHARRRVTPMTSSELKQGQSSKQTNPEPGLYRQPSRSMVNLSMSRRNSRLKRKKSCDTVQSNAPSVSGNTVDTVESDTDRMIGKLLRRTSMPTFTSTSDPPPYPSFDPRPKSASLVQSREEEDRERLPSYTNSLYLSAIMPRKMEFSSPGVQAKDRKWRRVFCELEGTALRVYKCPPGASGAGIIGEWWERRVGVGDLTSAYHAPRPKPKEAPTPSSSKIEAEQASASLPGSSFLPSGSGRELTESRAANRSPTPTPSTSRANRRMSGASFLTPWRNTRSSSQLRGRDGPSTSQQPDTNGGIELLPVSEPTSRRNSLSSSASHEDAPPPTPRTPAAPSRLSFLSSRMQLRSGEMQKLAKGDLIRTYTLQHAESGLGNDYFKRKNVIRVRLEGEQFLLQAADVPSVVEWIEGFQAGTNIALDLDQRVMPKGPMFPRRRRRRNRPSPNGDSSRPSQHHTHVVM